MTKREKYKLPPESCERLKRTELVAMKLMLAHLSTAAYWLDDLKERFECIPYGRQRAAAAVGMLRSICDDVSGTIPESQLKQLYGTMKDYDLRLLPKLSPGSPNIILTREDGVALINLARNKCHDCVEDGEGARQCKLYQFLEATTPLDDYGDGLLCPYMQVGWE